jgi:ABC-type dipeptide/oligopeptide/nickel transport system permease subunit
MADSSNSGAPFSDAVALGVPVKKYSEFKRTVSVFFGRPLPVVGLVITTILIIIAIFGPWIAPHDPLEMDVMNSLAHPSSEHLLGTDEIGRDTLSRLIYGARTSLFIGITVISISTAIGIWLGLIAATTKGAMHHIIMRITDGLMAFPSLILALLVAGLLGGGLQNIIVALTVGMIAPVIRITCAMALSVQENDYVISARAIGASRMRIMLGEILPNCLAPIIVMMTMGIGTTILAEAGLSFLGVGITPPTPVWGRMVNDGYKFLLTNPELSFSPGLAVMLVVFGFNMMGDGLRDALDPRLRGVV